MTVAGFMNQPVLESAQNGTEDTDEIRRFLAAISHVLQETIATFETTVMRITEITVTDSTRTDRDLVVALQDFDRLQQEFATLSEILAKLSTKTDGDLSAGSHDLIERVSLSDLKSRLARHLLFLSTELPLHSPEDVEF